MTTATDITLLDRMFIQIERSHQDRTYSGSHITMVGINISCIPEVFSMMIEYRMVMIHIAGIRGVRAERTVQAMIMLSESAFSFMSLVSFSAASTVITLFAFLS